MLSQCFMTKNNLPSIIAAVSVFSTIGVALRILLLRIAFFSSYHNFLPNCIGSFILGASSRYSQLAKVPLTQKGLQTGFCGSLTTFSSWIYNATASPSLSMGAQELVAGLTLPVVFFLLGRETADLSNLLLPNFFPDLQGSLIKEGNSMEITDTSSNEPENRREDAPKVRHCLQRCRDKLLYSNAISFDVIVLFTCALFSSIFLATLWVSLAFSTTDLVSCLIAPLGASLRFLLVTQFNKTGGDMRWGTLYANILAVIVTGVLLAIHTSHESRVTSFSVGLCGSLSTASSWVADAVAIRESPATLPYKPVLPIVVEKATPSDSVSTDARRGDIMRRVVAGYYYVGSVMLSLLVSVPFVVYAAR